MFVRTSDQILNSALDRLVRETDVSVTSPGTVARTFFEIISEEMSYNYRIMDANLSQMFVSTAGGDALDRLGTLFDVTRRSVQTSTDGNEGRVYFYLNSDPAHIPGTSDISATGTIVIPAGTLLSTDNIGNTTNPTTLKTTSSVTLDSGESMVYVSVVPVTSMVNTIGAGSLTRHNVAGVDNLYVYNRADLELVENAESDENYRYRISTAIHGAAKGNVLALRLAGLGSAGVRNCMVMPMAFGVGTVKVVITMEDPAATSAVADYSNAAMEVMRFASAGDLITCMRPSETLVSIDGYLMGDGIDSKIRDAAAASVVRYISSLSMGDALVPNRILHEIMSVSPKIRDFAIMDGGFALRGTSSVFARTDAKDDEQFYTTSNDIVIR
jgi:uncharacterized phage protein gp47/JayE